MILTEQTINKSQLLNVTTYLYPIEQRTNFPILLFCDQCASSLSLRIISLHHSLFVHLLFADVPVSERCARVKGGDWTNKRKDATNIGCFVVFNQQ